MLDPVIIEKIDRYWASDFGCSLDEYSCKYHIQKHAGQLALENNSGIYCLTRSDSTIISIPSEWFDNVQQLLPSSPFELANKLRSRASAIIGPAYIGYSQRELVSVNGAKAIDKQYHDEWLDLRKCCSQLEWDHGGSDLSQVCSGVFCGDQLVALAGYKVWGEIIAHISIITHPEFRGQGHARKAVVHLMNRAISNELIPQYQTLEANTSSIQVASALGFTRYASSIAIKLLKANAK